MFTGLGWAGQRTASWAPAGAAATIKTRDPLGGRTFESAAKLGFPSGRAAAACTDPPVHACVLRARQRGPPRVLEPSRRSPLQDPPLHGHRRQQARAGPVAPPIDPMSSCHEGRGAVARRRARRDQRGLAALSVPLPRRACQGIGSSLGGFGAALLRRSRNVTSRSSTACASCNRRISRSSPPRCASSRSTAAESLEALSRQLEAVQYRNDFYAGLICQGRNGWEEERSPPRGFRRYLSARRSFKAGRCLRGAPAGRLPVRDEIRRFELNTSIPVPPTRRMPRPTAGGDRDIPGDRGQLRHAVRKAGRTRRRWPTST